MEEFIQKIMQTRLVESIITIVISVVLYRIFNKIIVKGKKNKNIDKKLDNRQRTYIKLFSNILKYAFIILTILILLQINGINVSSMLAGVGILSAVIGLALQDALKDIIMGANIVTDDFFSVGDVIKYKDIEGKVIGFGLKTTKIEDIATGNVITITNRSIAEAEKLSNNIFMDIPASYEISQEKMEEVAGEIIEKVKEEKYIDDCVYLGLSSFEESYVIYKLQIKCKPEYRYPVKRVILKAIKEEMDANKINIPYQQITIHNNL